MTAPTKLPLKANRLQYAVYLWQNYGPVFGRGPDLCVRNNANTDNNPLGWVGNTYQLPGDAGGNNTQFFTGTDRFLITDYEVFPLAPLP